MAGCCVRPVCRRALFVVTAIGLTGLWSVASGQQLARAESESRVEVRQGVTVRFDNALVRTVVKVIAEHAGLKLSYNVAVIPPQARVTVHLKDVPVKEAFEQALRGTGLVAKIQSTGNVVVVAGDSTATSTVGVIAGKITDSMSGKGVPGATILVQGTKLSTTTSEQGTYTLREVPGGKQAVVIRAFGYKSVTRAVTVEPGKAVNVLAILVPVSVTLNEVVTTAIGDQKRMEVGNAVATLNADSIVASVPVNNLSDLIGSRVAGVVVSTSSGLVGAPSKIRMRGINSPVLNNDPIVIVDGVRLQSQVTTASAQSNLGAVSVMSSGVANALFLTPSRIDDIDPNTIESIDILRGPSASSLYGTEATNGVIVIETKRGRPGPLRKSFSLDHAMTQPTLPVPSMVGLGSSAASPTLSAMCRVVGVDAQSPSLANGLCQLDTVIMFSPQSNPEMRTLARSSSTGFTGNLSGGSETLQQFLSFSTGSQTGPVKMSAVEERRLVRQWGVRPPGWMRRPNQARRAALTSSTTLRATPRMSISLSLLGTYNNTRGGGTGLEQGHYSNGLVTPLSLADTLLFFSAEVMRSRMGSTAKRGTASLSASADPFSWLSFAGTVGGDYGSVNTDLLTRDRDCTLIKTSLCAPSQHRVTRNDELGVTATAGVTTSFDLWSWLRLRTSLGEQYNSTKRSGMSVGNASGTRLGFGTDLLSPTPIPTQEGLQLFSVGENRDASATAGWYVSQQIAISQQLFFDVGFRQDVASAFGKSVLNRLPSYPKFSMSWNVPTETFTRVPWLTSLRFRSAFGHAGQQARQDDVLNQFESRQWVANGSTVRGILVSRIGNADLRPERGTELEGGVDLSFFANERLQLEATISRKLIKDQIVGTSLPQSYGLTNTYGGGGDFTQLWNLGSVVNRAFEAALNARLLESRTLVWSVSVNMARSNQKLLTLIDPTSPFNPLRTEFRVGYPLFSYFGYRVLSYSDINGDGYLGYNEVTISQDRSYFGPSYPRATMGYNTSVSLWGGMIGVTANLEHVIGLTTQLRTPGLFDRNASLARQAGEVEALVSGGYIRETDHLRLGNVSMSWAPPRAAARLLHAQSLTVNLSGTNLGLWTNYVGTDPRIETARSGLGERAQLGDNGSGVAPPRTWNIRVNVVF